MEKLIRLLDIYRRGNKTEELFGEPGTLVPLTGKEFIMLNRVIIISKEYGFIKWLVDNDKINLDELSKKELATGWSLENNILDEDHTKESWIRFWTEILLMLLAISDSPIRFLTEILKTKKQYTEEEQELIDLDYGTGYTKKFVK